MNKKFKILIFSILLLFGLVSCQNSNESKNISTVSVLEKKLENNNNNNNNKTTFCNQFIKKGYYYKIWSDTEPQINETHIFCGEFNKRGKPIGFHSKINGNIPETIKILKTENKNKFGVYNSQIEIYDIKNKKFKNKFSSIFPDNLTKEQVEKAILNAWKNKYYYKNSQFKGKSGLGFEIWGYTYKGDDKINTAYPIYKK